MPREPKLCIILDASVISRAASAVGAGGRRQQRCRRGRSRPAGDPPTPAARPPASTPASPPTHAHARPPARPLAVQTRLRLLPGRRRRWRPRWPRSARGALSPPPL